MQLVVLVGFGWSSWVWLGIIFKFESLNRDWYKKLLVFPVFETFIITPCRM